MDSDQNPSKTQPLVAESHPLETVAGLVHPHQLEVQDFGAYALMIFFAFAMQCFSTVAIVRRELGSWAWPAAQFAYMGFLAYFGALVTNQMWLAFR